MIRRLFFSVFVFALLGLSMTASAQSDPLPLPPDATAPMGPVERTADDLEAIRQLEEAGMRGARSSEPRAASHFDIPRTIRIGLVIDYTNQETINATSGNIHCSVWLANGQPVYSVIELDFREYVKNVLPNEWVHTWHSESLRAGAVSAKMFAWWRYNTLERFPTIRPNGVHVVNNTCDQVFIQNSQRPSTNEAIDATWQYRLHADDYVVEIHYLARDYQCSATGWPRCLPQWTTQDMALEGKSWQEMINQYYSPISISIADLRDIPGNTNVIQNSGFGSGTDGWKVSSSSEGAGVVDGVFRYHRGIGGGAAKLHKSIGMTVQPGAALRVTVKLGNDSAVKKKVVISIQRIDGRVTARQCAFTLAPHTPLQKYTIWGITPGVWSGIKLLIKGNTADSAPSYLIDDVQLQYRPGAVPAESCVDPSPGKPKIMTPTASGAYRTNMTVTLAEGKSNHVIGYDPAFHIQIDDDSNFSSPVFDNAAALADMPEIPVTLPGGTLYVRARQYDGIKRYSGWTAGVSFTVNPRPDKPVLSGPVGKVPAEGQNFVWTDGLQTAKYQLIVFNRAGKVLVKRNYKLPNAACDAGFCTVPLSSVPVVWKNKKAYTWSVKAINPAAKVKSAKATFKLIPTP